MASFMEQLNQLQDDLNNLDVNDIGRWPVAVKVIALVLALALLLGLGYYLHLTPKFDALARAEKDEQRLRSTFEDKYFQAANLEALKRQREEMLASFGALLRQLPSDTEVPGLIEDITLTALNNGLRIESIDLSPESPREFYIELPISIRVTGGFHNLGAFVSGVANLPRIVTLHDFSIAPAGGPTNLTMNITAKTYRYLDEN